MIVQSAAHSPVRNARTTLATRIVTGLAATFLLLVLSLPAHSVPPVPAPPPFPVGDLRAFPTIVQPGAKVSMTWSIKLPANANTADYTFFIRQKLHASPPIQWDMADIASEGESLSALPVNPYGATFELWAVKTTTTPPTYYLLDSTTVGPYIPMASVKIVSEDPYPVLPRTRADRPFSVQTTVTGIISDPSAPESSKSVTLLHHVQPYGPAGTGDPLDRTHATQLSATSITTNNFIPTSHPFPANQIPGENRAKVRGEERFSIFSAADSQLPASHLDSQLIQIWPVADASITGIAQGQILSSAVPQLTCQLNDLYPKSTTWAQIYQGAPRDGIIGTIIPESVIALNTIAPTNSTITLNNYGPLLTTDGIWTMELITETPFGTDRLARVTFSVNRSGTTITDWRQTHFNDPSNTGDGADDNDYDHDGLANLIEFAFGLHPKQSDAHQLPQPQRIADQLVLRFTPPTDITGIRYGAQSSTTLLPGSWQPVPNTGIPPEHLFTLPTTTQPRLYLRLTTDQP